MVVVSYSSYESLESLFRKGIKPDTSQSLYLLPRVVEISRELRVDNMDSVSSYWDPFECRKLNAFLPYDIAVHSICAVKPDAHARFDALKRTYQYHISIEKSPFRYDYSMPLTLPLNVDVMNEAAQILFDYTDFQCFSKTHTDVKTFNCKIYKAHWAIVGGELVFTITADRFLRNMVRAIVGTLINVGLQKLSLTGFEDIIISKSRSKAGASVPACGLFLTQVTYPEEIFLQKSN